LKLLLVLLEMSFKLSESSANSEVERVSWICLELKMEGIFDFFVLKRHVRGTCVFSIHIDGLN
jgi:hypothetical protein